MSRIDELIRELCPDGVVFEPIGAVVQPVSTVRWSEVMGEEFQYIDLTSVDRVTHAITQTQTISGEDAPSRAQQLVREGDVIFGTTRPMLRRYTVIPAEYDGQIASTGYCVLRPQQDRVLTNFLFHLLGIAEFYAFLEANQRGASYPSIPDGVVKRFKIPVPPLEVQREIVRVLDLFTTLEAELEAELEARRRQYAHYRDALLTFPEGGVRWATLGEFGSIFGGLTGKAKADFAGGNARFVSYVNVFNNSAVDTAVNDFVRVKAGERQRALQRGDVLFTGSSETPDEVGMSAVVTAEVSEPLYLNSFCIGYRPNNPSLLYPDFAKHLFRSAGMREKIIRTASGVTRFNVSKARLARVELPIPALGEQRRIARILDTLDALVNDLAVGLPAELAARRTQYEYYRDRLLTFKEAAA